MSETPHLTLFKKYQDFTDYFPIMLIALIFAAEHEMETHARNISLQILATIVCALAFFSIIYTCGIKWIALLVAFILWFGFIAIKKKW